MSVGIVQIGHGVNYSGNYDLLEDVAEQLLHTVQDMVNHPRFGVCWDTAHGNLASRARRIRQYNNITAIGDKLMGLHISDNFGDGAHHHSWPFAGIINFAVVMQGLTDVKFTGALAIDTISSL